jgi:hypothetical protein
MTPAYRYEIVSIVIWGTVPTNTEASESGATVVGPFITWMHWNHFVRALDIE